MIQNRFISLSVLIFFSLVVVGCSAGEGVPRILGDDTDKPLDEDVRILFVDNKMIVLSLLDFCKNNVGVKWLGFELDAVDLASTVTTIPTSNTLNLAREKLEVLGAEALMCTRDWSVTDSPLVSVTLPLHGAGLSVSGAGKGIRYLKDSTSVVKDKIEKGELKALDSKGWYIYSS